MTGDDERLIEAVTGAYRTRDARGVRFHPFWHDLDDEGRQAAYERTREARAIEAALDPDGLSATARAVLARITGARSAP